MEILQNNPVRCWFMKFFASNPNIFFGDATLFLEYGDGGRIVHAILFDTGMDNSDTVKLLQKAGITGLDLIVISHDHGDHLGFLPTILEKFTVAHVCFPDQTGVKKYQKVFSSRVEDYAARAKKRGSKVTYIQPGQSITVGCVKVECMWQADAGSLKEKDGHHFINNMSPQMHVCVYPGTKYEWVFDMSGDMSKEAIQLMLKTPVKNRLRADFSKFRWHGDRDGITIALASAVKARAWISNYHHKESSGGRRSTYQVARNAGADVFANSDDGEVYIDMGVSGGKSTATIYGSDSKRCRTYTKSEPGKSYIVRLTTKLGPAELDAGTIAAIETEDYTPQEIAALKATGATILGYISVGTVSNEQKDLYKKLENYRLSRLEDWPHEWYIDLRKEAVRDCIKAQAEKVKRTGVDGFWADNIDLYEYYPSQEMYEGISSVLDALHRLGFVMVNGGIEYIGKAMDKDGSSHQGIGNVDGVTQEEVFSRITSYKGNGQFSAQTSGQSAEYQKYLERTARHRMIPALLEYTRDSGIRNKISSFCAATGALACVSDKVNL